MALIVSEARMGDPRRKKLGRTARSRRIGYFANRCERTPIEVLNTAGLDMRERVGEATGTLYHLEDHSDYHSTSDSLSLASRPNRNLGIGFHETPHGSRFSTKL